MNCLYGPPKKSKFRVDIDHIAQRLCAMIREDRQMQAIPQIPGVGELTALALVAAVGDFSTFKTPQIISTLKLALLGRTVSDLDPPDRPPWEARIGGVPPPVKRQGLPPSSELSAPATSKAHPKNPVRFIRNDEDSPSLASYD